jgi:competence transcription factor ComK
MIIEITKLGTPYFLETAMVLYAYNNAGLEIVSYTTSIYQAFTDINQTFSNAEPNVVTAPSYASFVTQTQRSYFSEFPHATLTNVCVNLQRIQKIIEIDPTHTKIYFDRFNQVNVVAAIADVQAQINAAVLSYTTITDEVSSDGTGTVTTSQAYQPGSLKVYVDGTRTSPSRITEITPTTYTIANAPEIGSTIITDFIP